MTTSRSKTRPTIALPRGHTLMELVVAMTSASLLMVGMGGTVYIASLALHDEDSNPVQQVKDRQLLEQLMDDVRFAQSFSEQSSKAITFTVPDRDDDGSPETIRYAWSGTSGDPLTYSRNGSTPTVIAEDVKEFSLTALTRTMSAPPPADPEGPTLLFVVTDVNNPTSQELAREVLFDDWGYNITRIDDGDSQANYDAAIAESDVAYISEQASFFLLATKLKQAPIGVVNGNMLLTQAYGFMSGFGTKTRDEIKIIDNAHYITSEFSLGYVTIFSAEMKVLLKEGSITPDADVLAQAFNVGNDGNNKPSLVIIPTGGQLYGGGTAAGRRVQLPWGTYGFNINSLNTNGQTLMRRAIEWCAEATDGGDGGGDGEPGEETDIYVNDIAMSSRRHGQTYYGRATIWIKDDTGADVAGATVHIQWSGVVSGTDQGVTGADGKIMLESPGKSNGGTFTCTVTNVVKTGLTYNASLNVETSDSIKAEK